MVSLGGHFRAILALSLLTLGYPTTVQGKHDFRPKWDVRRDIAETHIEEEFRRLAEFALADDFSKDVYITALKGCHLYVLITIPRYDIHEVIVDPESEEVVTAYIKFMAPFARSVGQAPMVLKLECSSA